MRSSDRTVEIFWTGGFDSTFRIIQLSQEKVRIIPYYISDNRQSESYELNAINRILGLLAQKEKTKCSFDELILIDKNSRETNKDIQDSFERIIKKDFIGSQYAWLAAFALKHPGIELSIHRDDKAILLLNKNGSLNMIHDPSHGDVYILEKKNADCDLWNVFGAFSFPIADYTKKQMRDIYIRDGYEDVMNATWFCHRPIHGKPCGICNPCIYTIEEGLKERLPLSARLRYRVKRILKH